MNREEEKAVEWYPFLLDHLFCWPFIGCGAHIHISASLGAVVPVQGLKTNGSKGGKDSISSCNSEFYMGLKVWTGRAKPMGLILLLGCLWSSSQRDSCTGSHVQWEAKCVQPCFLALRPIGIEWAAPMLLNPEKQGGCCQTHSGGAVPLVVPRIYGLLGGELACLGQVCARTSWTG